VDFTGCCQETSGPLVPPRVATQPDGLVRSGLRLIGRQTIRFKNPRPKETGVTSVRSGAVIQALRHLGRRAVDQPVIETLRRLLSDDEKRDLVRDARQSVDWIYAAARDIAGESG